MSSRSANHASTTESWVEISSQPSSSSLSSVADEIVTTGLRVQAEPTSRRRRRRRHLQTQAHGPSPLHGRHRSTSSSQEEYEESESESDHILTSSNDELPRQSQPDVHQQSSLHPLSDSTTAMNTSSDDEAATALGITSPSVFTPQPHAFTRSSPSSAPQSYFPSTSSAPRPQTRQRPSHYTSQSQPDHDAALRASLSTLLSCAAAARGLPKPPPSSSNTHTRQPPTGPRVHPSDLRLVPESIALGGGALSSPHSSPPLGSETTPSTYRSKRKGSPTGKRDRLEKRVRRGQKTEDLSVSPTLLTWGVAAGVVVLVGVVGFGAGYAMGREVGRAEAAEARCGREVVRGGLRRWRWSAGAAVGRVGA
ncbi:MAG: hypothetical protein M1824_000559 [Vezdaea acicularis]|nr:MAG: hypothetical protein M1824_000559 [Vezdaea acicularis]